MRIEDSWAWHRAVSTLQRGDPLPVDVETKLMEMGCDIAALKYKYEL